MDLKDKTGAFTVKSIGINRFALSPFLSSFSNPEDLAEVALEYGGRPSTEFNR
jgi:hypothetical protein